MRTRRRIVFRADGNSTIGLGHVVRCLALSSMLRKHFRTEFAIQAPGAAVTDMILKDADRVLGLPENEDLHADLDHFTGQLQPGDIVVLDGYRFDSVYQKGVRDDGHRFLAVIDDLHAHHMYADAVINHQGGISPSAYQTEPYTRLYLGPQYALLRAPFLNVDPSTRTFADPNRFFVCMGGADPHNLNRKALEALLRVPRVAHALVVIGSANPHRADLESLVPQLPFPVQLLVNLDAGEMAAAMQSCGSALTPASSLSMEAASVGMRLFVGHYAENQVHFYDYLTSRGLAAPLGDLQTAGIPELAARIRAVAPARRMIQRQQTVFGGRQREKLFEVFEGWI
ncbi:MAG: UDP-2,4-diacetamido-2,4,6-trideoxy-beta-L-altropyranose hydrolase [Bacteroidota bacterium]